MATDNLQELDGVGPATADKLLDAGYDSFMAVAVANPSELDEDAGIGESTAKKVIRSARDEADVGGFESAMERNERRQKVNKMTTGVEEVDELFGGGLETQAITEFFGEFGAGKSQVTHQMCVNVQLPPEHGGLNGRAVFLDTENSFRSDRIREMVRGLPEEVLADCMERDGVDGTPSDEDAVTELEEVFLERVLFGDTYNSNHQILMMDEEVPQLAQEYNETDFPVRFVAVDSIMGHLRPEYTGRGELAERQQKLNKHIHDIMSFASLHNSVAVIANQVSADPDSYFGDPTQAIGGNILGHNSTFRAYLRKSKDTKRICRLVDAPNLPDGEATFRVTNRGLEDE